MSSSEILKLIRCLCLICGNSIPRENVHWRLLTSLKTIVEIVVSSVVHKDTPQLLSTLIEEYLHLHNQLFPGKMRPKHHFVIHYPRVMSAVGPL